MIVENQDAGKDARASAFESNLFFLECLSMKNGETVIFKNVQAGCFSEIENLLN